MRFRLRPLVAAAPRMLRDPYDLGGIMRVTMGIGETRPMQWWFWRLGRDLSPGDADRLSALTLAPVDLAPLRALPHGTFGRAYASFLDSQGLDPEYFLHVHPPAARIFEEHWILYRYAKVHDMLHVLLGVSIWMPEEIGLQLFHMTNLRDPFSAGTLALLPLVALRYGHPRRAVAESWRLGRLGAQVPPLLFFPFEERWEQPLVEMRAELGLPPEGAPRLAA